MTCLRRRTVVLSGWWRAEVETLEWTIHSFGRPRGPHVAGACRNNWCPVLCATMCAKMNTHAVTRGFFSLRKIASSLHTPSSNNKNDFYFHSLSSFNSLQQVRENEVLHSIFLLHPGKDKDLTLKNSSRDGWKGSRGGTTWRHPHFFHQESWYHSWPGNFGR